jgi:hypothetical protein
VFHLTQFGAYSDWHFPSTYLLCGICDLIGTQCAFGLMNEQTFIHKKLRRCYQIIFLYSKPSRPIGQIRPFLFSVSLNGRHGSVGRVVNQSRYAWCLTKRGRYIMKVDGRSLNE